MENLKNRKMRIIIRQINQNNNQNTCTSRNNKLSNEIQSM